MLVEEWVGLTCEPKRQACWLQVMSHLSPRYGGIAASVPGFARATEAASAHACPIVGFCEQEELDQLPEERRAGITVFPPDRLRWMVDTRLKKGSIKTPCGATGVHIHGLWETHCMMAGAQGASAQASIYHFRPRHAGAVGIASQAPKEGPLLRRLDRDSRDEIRCGPSRPSAPTKWTTIAAWVYEPDRHRAGGHRRATRCRSRSIPQPVSSARRQADRALSGANSSEEGFHLLLKARSRTFQAKDVHLVIAGPDSEGHQARLEQLRDDLNLRMSVTFTGMLTAERKGRRSRPPVLRAALVFRGFQH